MNTPSFLRPKLIRTTTALTMSAILLGGCAMTPASPEAANEARAKLTALQQDPDMVTYARVELRDAEAAVRLAEQPVESGDADLAAHRVYMADRRVEIARARGEARLLEAQRDRMSEERDAARLAARTREADQAHASAERAQREQADAAALAARESEAMQREIDALQAKKTERGLVLTLGDVLFASGSAAIQGGTNANLEKLAAFLNRYPERQVLIEGHTDNVGPADYNLTLSRQRAESVRRYLTDQGVNSQRLTVAGYGFERPVADNRTAIGRQQNRRVEVIIDNGGK